MTEQRDLAKEVEEISKLHDSGSCMPGVCVWHERLGTALDFIASQSRELEELRKSLDHWKDCHGLTADRLAETESELAALRAENERLKEMASKEIRICRQAEGERNAAQSEVTSLKAQQLILESQLAALRRPVVDKK